MRISLIAAVAANGVIGAGGTLPWHLPDDFRWFKAQTMGKPVVMGRKTWESLAGALPGRRNIVLTRDPGYVAAGATVVDSPEAAKQAAGNVEEIMVIGGGEIYRAFMPDATRIFLTHVDAVVPGDTNFPVLSPEEWVLVSSDSHPADKRHAHEFEFRVYERAIRAIGDV